MLATTNMITATNKIVDANFSMNNENLPGFLLLNKTHKRKGAAIATPGIT